MESIILYRNRNQCYCNDINTSIIEFVICVDQVIRQTQQLDQKFNLFLSLIYKLQNYCLWQKIKFIDVIDDNKKTKQTNTAFFLHIFNIIF